MFETWEQYDPQKEGVINSCGGCGRTGGLFWDDSKGAHPLCDHCYREKLKKEKPMTDNKWGDMSGEWEKKTSVYPSWCHCSACGPSAPGSTYYQNMSQPVNSASLCESCYQTHVVEPSEGVGCDMVVCDVKGCKKDAVWCSEDWGYEHLCEEHLSVVNRHHGEEVPTLEPLKEWSDDLVGRNAVCTMGGYYNEGEQYEILASSSSRTAQIKDSKGTTYAPDMGYFKEHFAISPSQPGQEEGEMKDVKINVDCLKYLGFGSLREIPTDRLVDVKSPSVTVKYLEKKIQDYIFDTSSASYERLINATPQPITETTHSCTLEFPNGDVVEIPGPGDGWESEEKKFWPPESLCDAGYTVEQESYPDNQNWFIHASREDAKYAVNHLSGQLIVREYSQRIFEKTPIILSLTKHTRTYTPTVEVDTVHEALSAFPLLNGVK